MSNSIPEMFEFYIGGFGADCYTIKYEDRKLTDSQSDSVCSPYNLFEITPSQAEWEQFWQKLTDLNVWKWKTRYDDPGVLDGTQWNLEIKIDGKMKKSSGSNEYPESFDTFLEAVSMLVGSLPVR